MVIKSSHIGLVKSLWSWIQGREVALAFKVIMPALGMAQETGKLLSWLKKEGERVSKGEPIMEVETDKAAVELEAGETGILRGISAKDGDIIPVGQVIAWILAENEALPVQVSPAQPVRTAASPPPQASQAGARTGTAPGSPAVPASPVAARMAQEHGIDLSLVKPGGERVEKVDVQAYLSKSKVPSPVGKVVPASPKARRLAKERGLEIASLRGSGPGGAVLAADIPVARGQISFEEDTKQEIITPSTIWQRMAERLTQSWTNAPHFYLLREVDASRLIAWRDSLQKRLPARITYTDMLVKLTAVALQQHPAVNSTWQRGTIIRHSSIHIGLAVAVEQGLVVPVIHNANLLTFEQIAARRQELVGRAQAGRLRLEDLQGGTFTISNLGMYGVDVFNAVINPPQAAILAVGRIADRVVPVNGCPAIRPMMVLSLSCDHRVVDGALGAQFLGTLANLIEEPLILLS